MKKITIFKENFKERNVNRIIIKYIKTNKQNAGYSD